MVGSSVVSSTEEALAGSEGIGDVEEAIEVLEDDDWVVTEEAEERLAQENLGDGATVAGSEGFGSYHKI